MSIRSFLTGEPFAPALVALGAIAVIALSTPVAVMGIPLMAWGWWGWFSAVARADSALTTHFVQLRLLPRIAISAALMVAGTFGVHFDSGNGLPSLVVLLVGASVWCLIPGRHGLLVDGDGPRAWTSLLIAGGLCRWAALTLVGRSLQSGLSPGGTLADSTGRVVLCLIVASGAACVCCIGQLWLMRKRWEPRRSIVCVIQLQASLALALFAAWVWSRTSPGTGGIDLLLPRIDDLPAILIAWDSLLIALLCASTAWADQGRRRRAASFVSTLALLDLAGIPPLPGFWLKWWTLQACLYPHHIEPFAGMFDLHEGFRFLALLLAIGQACVTIRLLTWLSMRVSASVAEDRNHLESRLASVSHE